MKKKKDWITAINSVLIAQIISALAGFGMFLWYMIFNWNVWVCIYMACLASSYMTIIVRKGIN